MRQVIIIHILQIIFNNYPNILEKELVRQFFIKLNAYFFKTLSIKLMLKKPKYLVK